MAQDPLLGYVLGGKYVIKRFVSEEMLGRVYYAETQPRNEPVSVKVLHPHMVDNPEVFGRFGREMLATATLDHPNVVRMIDFGEHRIFHYLVLEHLTARTLELEIRNNERIPWNRAAHIAAQIASVLARSHEESIVHRNLSSGNVLLLNDVEADYVKVRDFGLSRLQDEQGNADDGGLTAVGSRVGTTSYMAPEYIDLAQVDPRGDVYALGILLYEMLVGSPPFVGSAGMVMEMHIDQAPPAAIDMAPNVPSWLSDLILHMLSKSPEARPTADQVHHALETGCGYSLAPPQRQPAQAAPQQQAAPQAAQPPAQAKKKGCLPFLLALLALPGFGLSYLTLV